MSEVTEILNKLGRTDCPIAAADLFSLVYDELRRLAAAHIAREKPGHTMQATALVHEVYLRLMAGGGEIRFESERHFFVVAAEAMRRILVDCARRKAAIKRGGELSKVDYEDAFFQLIEQPNEAIAVSDALDELAKINLPAAELVKLHYFSGHSLTEAGALLGFSRAKAYRTWAYARAWLFAQLSS